MNYPLAQFGEFYFFEGRAVGLLVKCPNCGSKGMARFDVPIGGGPSPWDKTLWNRTGETLETLSLNPSFLMFNHFHSWIRNGELQVDSPFSCTAAA